MIAGLLAAVVSGAIFPSFLSAQTTTSVQCYYDALGQLSKTIDPNGNVITYTYDASGNVLQVSSSTISSATALSLFGFSPVQGGPGTAVTIQGTGFSATPGANTVKFNGIAATVTSASGTLLVVTVPATASTGPITITVSAQTATSPTNFTFLAQPEITSIAPTTFSSSASPFTIPSLTLTGANLTGAAFSFFPIFSPTALSVTSANINSSGNTAVLSAGASAGVVGSFTVVATNSAGSSSTIPTSANTINILSLPTDADEDHDGLINGVEFAIGSDPTNPFTAGDGIPDGWAVRYGANPLNAASASAIAPDGLTYLQNYLTGHDPTNTNVAPPTVSRVFPANNATNYPTNGNIVVRFSEPLRTAPASLTTVQNAIVAALPTNNSLTPSDITIAAQTLQTWLNTNGEGNSVAPGVVQLLQGSTPIPGNLAVSSDGLSITFAPFAPLSQNTTYTVIVPGVSSPTRSTVGVRDLAGDQIHTTFQSTFTTGLGPDNSALTIVQTNPTNNATGVPINAPIIFEFNKPIDPSTLLPQNFLVSDGIVGRLTGAVQVDPTNLTAAFIPNVPLPVGRLIGSNISNVKDASGNALQSQASFNFTTGFATETAPPTLVGTSPASGAIGVPLNAVIVLSFSEPLDVINASNGGLQVQLGGVSIPGAIALSSSNQQVTFTPAAPLTAGATYSIVTTSQITNVVGEPLANPGTATFTAGTAADNLTLAILVFNPAGTSIAPTNVVVQVDFNKPIDPLTVTNATFELAPSLSLGPGAPLPATVTVSGDGLSVKLVPAAPLAPSAPYSVSVCGIQDLEGRELFENASFCSFSFTTSGSEATVAPTVAVISPPNGSTGVPVNAHVAVQFSGPIDPVSALPHPSVGGIGGVQGSGSIVVASSAGVVAGTVGLSPDQTVLTFTPTAALAANTVYSITESGITDLAGNPVAPVSSSFTTSSSGVPITTADLLVSSNPTNGAAGVPVTTNIVLTFTNPIDPTSATLANLPVQVQSVGLLSGSLAVSGATVTFTPLTPFPGNTVIAANSTGLKDFAGNPAISGFYSFTTAATADTTSPQVISVTPGNGATNVGLGTQVVITFSKSLNAATVLNNLALFADEGGGNGALMNLAPGSVNISSDNRTVTLKGIALPPNTVISLVLTSGVQDLSGNSLAAFRSVFTTTSATPTVAPSIANERPVNGAVNVPVSSKVELFFNQPMNGSTLAGAVHASENGVLLSGTVTVGSSQQTLEFSPSSPFPPNSFIQVFVDTSAASQSGVSLGATQEVSFRTATDPATTAPLLISASPQGGVNSVPVNTVLDFGFSEPLDPTTVNNSAIALSPEVPLTVTLIDGGTVIHAVPNSPLAPSTFYSYSLNAGLKGANGLPLASGLSSNFFTTGTTSATTAPQVVSVTPPNGAANVGDNASIIIRFNGVIDPLSANSTTIQIAGPGTTTVPCNFTFSSSTNGSTAGIQNIQLTPQTTLPDNTEMTISISGVTDLAGNAVTPLTTHFNTANGPILTAPVMVAANPFSGATNVPLNAAISILLSAPVDPSTVNSSTLILQPGPIAGTYSVSADGKTINFVPNAPLVASTLYFLGTAGGGVTDLEGNQLQLGFSFTTGTTSDTVGPVVLGVSPANGSTVPTNAQIVIQFNKPIDAAALGGVTLTGGGGPVTMTSTFLNQSAFGNQQMVVFTPVAPLNALTTYTLTIAGVADLAGTPIAAPDVITFTTAAGADVSTPQVVTVTPPVGAIGVLTTTTVQIGLSKRINPLCLNSTTFSVRPNGSLTPVPGSITLSANGQILTFTPTSALAPSTLYFVNLFEIIDLEGNVASLSLSFTTGTQ